MTGITIYDSEGRGIYHDPVAGSIREAVESAVAHEVSLRRADLYGAPLYGAKLNGAILCEANLREAILYRSSLHKADLTDAALTGAVLTYANFTGAILANVDFTSAKIAGACFDDTDLTGVTGLPPKIMKGEKMPEYNTGEAAEMADALTHGIYEKQEAIRVTRAEAATLILRQAAQIERLRALVDGGCSCHYDAPDALCAYHAPLAKVAREAAFLLLWTHQGKIDPAQPFPWPPELHDMLNSGEQGLHDALAHIDRALLGGVIDRRRDRTAR